MNNQTIPFNGTINRQSSIVQSSIVSSLCLIILIRLERPEVRAHRLVAGGVLCLEGGLVTGDLTQVVHTSRYGGGYCTELRSLDGLCCRRSTLAYHFLTQVQTVAVRTGGLCYAMRCQQHLLAAVLRVTTRLCQCAGYTVNSGGISYFCHSRSAIGLVLIVNRKRASLQENTES